jgi:hypothetical protein
MRLVPGFSIGKKFHGGEVHRPAIIAFPIAYIIEFDILYVWIVVFDIGYDEIENHGRIFPPFKGRIVGALGIPSHPINKSGWIDGPIRLF